MSTVDIEYFMINDHQETNDKITEILSSSGTLDRILINEVDSMLRRHIFIEETILFPKLPHEMSGEVEYLEKEHGKFFELLDSILSNKDEDRIRESFRIFLALLNEHNSYEESFVYDFYRDEDAEPLMNSKAPSRDWKCKFS